MATSDMFNEWIRSFDELADQEFLEPEQEALLERMAEEIASEAEGMDEQERLRLALLMMNDAMKGMVLQLILQQRHTQEHCEALADAEKRIAFLETMLLGATPEDPE